MAGVKFPSSFDVTGRFPLDAKYWVDSFDNLSDGEISVGLHRWVLDTGKEYVYQKNNTWKEAAGGEKGNAATIAIGSVTKGNTAKVTNVGTSTDAIFNMVLPKGDAGSTPIIDIGRVRSTNNPNVTNVGTPDRAILNFDLPAGENGVNGIDGKSVFIAYAESITGLNPSYSSTGKKYISFIAAYQQPLLTAFTTWIQVEGSDGQQGKSIYIAYSVFSNGQSPSFVLNTTHKYISLLSAVSQPLLSEFTTWVLFKGQDGGPAGKSAYESWLTLGNNGTELEFINSLAGNNGLSAYQVWLNLGNVGTEQDFIDSLGQSTTTAAISSFEIIAIVNGPQTINIPETADKVIHVTIEEPSTYTRTTNSYTYSFGTLNILAKANVLIEDKIKCWYVEYTSSTRPTNPTNPSQQSQEPELTPVVNF